MQWVLDIQRSEGGWSVRVLSLTRQAAVEPGTNTPLLERARELRSVETDVGRFPLPPVGEATDSKEELGRLCAGDKNLLASFYRDVVSQSINLAGIKTFGRYLFLTLIGDPLWAKLIALSGNDGVELMLSWSPDHADLTRLPWEMMHGPHNFLCAEQRFSLAREVAGAQGELRRMSSPPLVLVVIGSGGGDRHFDGLKPGAEYFGLLRGLRHNGIGLNIVPLVGATPNRLKGAVKRLRPDVVHFICHGHQDGTIDLVDDDDAEQRCPFGAPAIYNCLSPGVDEAGEYYLGPQIVVLNACYSAAAGGIQIEDSGQVNFPMAAALVSKGIPVVVGMAGEVADQSCRLFGRSFYQSLLTDGRVLCAAAKGRRAGLLFQRGSQIDWALPTLFVSERAAGAQLSIVPDPHDGNWQKLAVALGPPPFPGYYARLDLLRAFETLMLDAKAQFDMENRVMELQVLGLSTADQEGAKFGRSSALSDLAALAARNGHVPILVDERLSGRWPVTVNGLVSFIMKAAQATLENLDLNAADAPYLWTVTRSIAELKPPDKPPPGTPADIANMFAVGDMGEYPDMLAAAIRWDLIEFLNGVRTQRGRPRAKLVLLLDDVHKMGDAIGFLLHHLFNTGGLRAQVARSCIRVVFAYSRRDKSAITGITDFLSARQFASDHSLTEFRDPTESQLAYENFLFNWRKGNMPMPLVPIRMNPAAVEHMFTKLRKTVRGIPSLLKDDQTNWLVDFCFDSPPELASLRLATDEDALRDTDRA